MPAYLPKHDCALALTRPPAGKAVPTPKAVRQFLEETRAELARSLPSAPGLQLTVSPRTRGTRQQPAVGRPPIDHATLDEVMSGLQQLAWACKTGWRPELDQEGLEILNEVVKLGPKIETLPLLRRQRVIMADLLDRVTEIYRDYSKGRLSNLDYEGAVSQALVDLSIEPSPELLDELVVPKRFIDNPDDAHGASPAKGGGPAETAKFTLAVVFEILGYTVPHSASSLQAVRTWSPAERARISTAQAFGSNVTLPPGMSAVASPSRTVIELRDAKGPGTSR